MAEPRFGVDATCRHHWSMEQSSPLMPCSQPSGSHWSRLHRAASLTNRKFLCNQGPWGLLALRSHIARVQPFPQSSLAPPASTLESAILLRPGARHHVPSSLLGPGCRLFFPCCLQHKKEHFFPNLLPIKKRKLGSRTRILPSLGHLFCYFAMGKRTGIQQLGLFLKLCFMKLIL